MKQAALDALEHLWGAVPEERKVGWKGSYAALHNYIELSEFIGGAEDGGPVTTDDGTTVPLPGSEDDDQGAQPEAEEDL